MASSLDYNNPRNIKRWERKRKKQKDRVGVKEIRANEGAYLLINKLKKIEEKRDITSSGTWNIRVN